MALFDNQQEISWFVGILDGEGSFDHRAGFINITNTDLDIIDKCYTILKNNGIDSKVYNDSIRIGRKPASRIYVPRLDWHKFCRLFGDKLECRLVFLQPESSSETTRTPTVDLHWLMGIWEAEGTLSLCSNHKDQYTPRIKLANTNEKIISKIRVTLNSLGAAYYCKDFRVGSKKPYTDIGIHGAKRAIRFLNIAKGLWRSSRNIKRSELLIKYINSRFSKPQNVSYSDEERNIYHQMQQLNG